MDSLFPDIPTDTKPKRAPHDNRLPLLAAYWNQRYQAKYHQKYIFTYSKDYILFKRLLMVLESSNRQSKIENLKCIPDPVVQITDAMDRFFNGKLTWYKGTETIGAFSKHINRLLTDDAGGKNINKIKPTQEQIDAYRRSERSD